MGETLPALLTSRIVWRYQDCTTEGEWGVGTCDAREQAGVCPALSSVSVIHLDQRPT